VAYWKSSYLTQLSDDAIDTMIACFAQCPSLPLEQPGSPAGLGSAPSHESSPNLNAGKAPCSSTV
jgi:hypothetical protein